MLILKKIYHVNYKTNNVIFKQGYIFQNMKIKEFIFKKLKFYELFLKFIFYISNWKIRKIFHYNK